jgi:hypothetical protein
LLFLGIGGATVFKTSREGAWLRIELRTLVANVVGAKVYRNASERLAKEILATENVEKVPIRVVLSGRVGEALSMSVTSLTARKGAACRAQAFADSVLEARSAPTDPQCLASLQTECRKWSGTPYTCVECEVRVDASAFVNAKMVRKLRQECLTMMTVTSLSAFKSVYDTPSSMHKGECDSPLPLRHGSRTTTPQVFKSADIALIETLVAQKPESIEVQNLGALRALQKMDTTGIRLVGGPALGACNSLATEWLLAQGLESVAPAFEVTHFAPAPAFHTAFCPITQWAGNGKRFPHCGKLCKRAHWQVMDHKGKLYEVQTDEACRTTVWG